MIAVRTPVPDGSKHLTMHTSLGTWHRQMRRASLSLPTHHELGLDSLALSKGHTYGATFVDIEEHCVVDMLHCRSTPTVGTKRCYHLDIETITRDRSRLSMRLHPPWVLLRAASITHIQESRRSTA